MEMEDDERLDDMEAAQSQIVHKWRRKWPSQVFSNMVPRPKWRVTEECTSRRSGSCPIGAQARISHVESGQGNQCKARS